MSKALEEPSWRLETFLNHPDGFRPFKLRSSAIQSFRELPVPYSATTGILQRQAVFFLTRSNKSQDAVDVVAQIRQHV